MRTNRPLRTALPAATALAALLAAGLAHAQDTQSATDATGAPVESADGMEMDQTDGLIRYGDADEMWQKLSSADGMSDMAAERWPEIDAARFGEVGSKEDLVALVSEGYSIDEQDAMREVDSWVMETADDL